MPVRTARLQNSTICRGPAHDNACLADCATPVRALSPGGRNAPPGNPGLLRHGLELFRIPLPTHGYLRYSYIVTLEGVY